MSTPRSTHRTKDPQRLHADLDARPCRYAANRVPAGDIHDAAQEIIFRLQVAIHA